MSLRKTLFVICLLISVLCLAVGYWIAGHRIGALIVSFIGPAWWLARKYPVPPLPFVCLSISVGVAVTGRLMGVPPLLMIFGSAAALAVWDILLLDSALGNDSSLGQTRRYEKGHLQLLMWALGCGLLATLLGRLSSIQIPFVVLMLSITFILFALDRIWGYIKKAGKP